MIKLCLDKTQVAAAVANLNAITTMEDGGEMDLNQVANDLTEAMRNAVAGHSDESRPFQVDIGPFAMVVWPLPRADQEKYGYTHECSLFPNPVHFMRERGADQQLVVIDAPIPENHPRRLRYMHIRRYDVITAGGRVVAEELLLKGGFTVCFQDNMDGTLSYAVAKCRNDEFYTRAGGRFASSQNLMDNPKTVTMTINEFRPWVEREIQQGRWK